jgi:DNA-binding helix-hairpin-helix protein with protein kinase domain
VARGKVSGDTLEIGRQIGRGGEGAVYEVVGRPNEVAKIYHEVMSSEKAAKLKAMIRLAVPQLLESAAWPTETLHRARGGAPVGFVMAKVTRFREIHALYSPAHRKQEFPNANWKFLVVSARNVANVFASLHAAGHVISDVNQGNVVVSSRATVKLIDCDSFQIVSEGRQFLCEVGVGHFTPPELQGRRFSGLVRTPNHDRFGLAVLCFHLLFAGRHPHAGRFLGTGDMPIEKAIREI